MKTKRKFVSPQLKVAETDLEGLLCNSVRFNVQVNPWENMNDPADATKGRGAAENEVFYFES